MDFKILMAQAAKNTSSSIRKVVVSRLKKIVFDFLSKRKMSEHFL